MLVVSDMSCLNLQIKTGHHSAIMLCFVPMCKLAHCLCPKIWSPTWGSSNFAVENVFNYCCPIKIFVHACARGTG